MLMQGTKDKSNILLRALLLHEINFGCLRGYMYTIIITIQINFEQGADY